MLIIRVWVILSNIGANFDTKQQGAIVTTKKDQTKFTAKPRAISLLTFS